MNALRRAELDETFPALLDALVHPARIASGAGLLSRDDCGRSLNRAAGAVTHPANRHNACGQYFSTSSTPVQRTTLPNNNPKQDAVLAEVG